MVNMTLAIPDELHTKMKQFNEIKWPEVVRKAIEQRVHDLELLDNIASKSQLTVEDAEEISRTLKKSAAKKFLSA